MWLYIWEGFRVVVLPIFLALIVVIINNRRLDKADEEDSQRQAALYLVRAKRTLKNTKRLETARAKHLRLKSEQDQLDESSTEYYEKEREVTEFYGGEYHRIFNIVVQDYTELDKTKIEKLPVKLYTKCVAVNEFKTHLEKVDHSIRVLEETIEALEQYLETE